MDQNHELYRFLAEPKSSPIPVLRTHRQPKGPLGYFFLLSFPLIISSPLLGSLWMCFFRLAYRLSWTHQGWVLQVSLLKTPRWLLCLLHLETLPHHLIVPCWCLQTLYSHSGIVLLPYIVGNMFLQFRNTPHPYKVAISEPPTESFPLTIFPCVHLMSLLFVLWLHLHIFINKISAQHE